MDLDGYMCGHQAGAFMVYWGQRNATSARGFHPRPGRSLKNRVQLATDGLKHYVVARYSALIDYANSIRFTTLITPLKEKANTARLSALVQRKPRSTEPLGAATYRQTLLKDRT